MAQVVQVTRFGPPEVLAATAVPDLVPGPGEVIIAVSAADVLLLDAVIRSGLAAAWFPIAPPYVPGNGVAGRISAVGDGVDPGWAGRAVIAHTGEGGGSGGYAEQARVQASQLVAVPDGWACWRRPRSCMTGPPRSGSRAELPSGPASRC
jgi:NADPH2:quinone reductase